MMDEVGREEVLRNIFEVDNMFFYVRRFMRKFVSLLVHDYEVYISNIQYFNWIIFGMGFLSLFIGWYFVIAYVIQKISFAFIRLKHVLKIFPLEFIKSNRYITSYLENVKGT